MNAKDALIIALKVENQNLRSERDDALRGWASARLPRITSEEGVFEFDDYKTFAFRLALLLVPPGPIISISGTTQGKAFLCNTLCDQVRFEQNRIIFLEMKRYASGGYKELFSLEIRETGYTAHRDWGHEAQHAFVTFATPKQELAHNENPFFYTLELERKLREFCARHNLLKEAS